MLLGLTRTLRDSRIRSAVGGLEAARAHSYYPALQHVSDRARRDVMTFRQFGNRESRLVAIDELMYLLISWWLPPNNDVVGPKEIQDGVA